MGFLFLRLARKEPAVWSHGAHIFLHLPLSASLATLRLVLRRCWEEPLAPPPHTRGRMCSQRCPLWACFLSDGNKTEILNLWAVFVPCCPLVGCCVEKHWYIGDMWRVHVQKHVVRSCTDVVVHAGTLICTCMYLNTESIILQCTVFK